MGGLGCLNMLSFQLCLGLRLLTKLGKYFPLKIPPDYDKLVLHIFFMYKICQLLRCVN